MYTQAKPLLKTYTPKPYSAAPTVISSYSPALSRSSPYSTLPPLQLQLSKKLHLIQIHENTIVPKHAQYIKSNSSKNLSLILLNTYSVISWFFHLFSYFFITESKYSWIIAKITPKTFENINKYFFT